MHLFATLSKLGARKKTIVIPLWTTYSTLDPPRLAPGVDRARKKVIVAETKQPFYLCSRLVAIVQQKAMLKKNPFYSIHRRIRFVPKLLSILARVWASAFYITDQRIDSDLQFATTREASSSVFIFFFFYLLFFRAGWRYSLVTWPPYLGQIAPVAVFTAREGARSVYPGVFGRAVLATLPIGLPRPFLLLRAADIGPTVKTHCLFPPSLREPDGHATYTQRHEEDRWLVPVCVCVCVCLVASHRRDTDFAIQSDRVIEPEVWPATFDNTARIFDIAVYTSPLSDLSSFDACRIFRWSKTFLLSRHSRF